MGKRNGTGEILYAGTNPEVLGIVEHDCLDCMYSWDLDELQVANVCPKCHSPDIVHRKAKKTKVPDTCGFPDPEFEERRKEHYTNGYKT